MLSPNGEELARSSAGAHAGQLLRDLGLDPGSIASCSAPRPAEDWARSGAQWLTGEVAAPPLGVSMPVAACARGAWLAAARLAPTLATLDLDAPALLGERAAIAGLSRAGRETVGGMGRMLRARDGWLVVQLPRPDDVAALPAWLESEPSPDTPVFDWVAAHVRHRYCEELIERARWLGLAVSRVVMAETSNDTGQPPPPAWMARRAPMHPKVQTSDRRPVHGRHLRVLDLSTLWAGPLCGSLLGLAGADVVKVEHARRPDGARLGSARFFDLLNANKSNLSLDATEASDRAVLMRLIAAADIVIESARPRGLLQLGIDAAALVDLHPGLTWISITGYGRPAPAGEWIGFGDDAAASTGLVARDAQGDPVFCGDAIADPLTGLHATLAALAGAHTGGGLFDLPLAGVAHAVVTAQHIEAPCADDEGLRLDEVVERPRARLQVATAHAIGADATRDVLARWSITCAGDSEGPGC